MITALLMVGVALIMIAVIAWAITTFLASVAAPQPFVALVWVIAVLVACIVVLHAFVGMSHNLTL